jgi:hypothetical protein
MPKFDFFGEHLNPPHQNEIFKSTASCKEKTGKLKRKYRVFKNRVYLRSF